MAGPKPQDEYNPVPTVAPGGAPSNDTLSVRASPADFGAQIGQAMQGAGSEIRSSGNEMFNTALQIQGLANEHAANMAEQELAIRGGDIYEKYKSLTGMDAANSKDAAVQSYVALSNSIREKLPNAAAQRAYDSLATRRLSFTIQDMNGYAGQQRRSAYQKGNLSGIQIAQDTASRIDPSKSPDQFNAALGDVRYNINALFTSPEYGTHRTLPVTEDKDGKLVFDQSVEGGAQAQAEYDNYTNQQMGKVWENAFTGMAINGNVEKTMDLLQQNKDRMPANTYATLVSKLHGPYLNDLAHRSNEGILSNWLAKYDNQQVDGIKSYPNNIANVKRPDLKGFQNPETPNDGVILAASNLRGDLYQGKTLRQIAATWTGEPDKAEAWAQTVSKASGIGLDQVPDRNKPEIIKALVKGMNLAEKSQADRALFSDDVISRGVDDQFSGAKPKLLASSDSTSYSPFTSKTDFLDANTPEILEDSRAYARDKLGLDATGQDHFVDAMKTRLSEIRTSQTAEVRQLKNSLLQVIQKPGSGITNVIQLDNNPDPAVRQQWMDLQQKDYWGSQVIRNKIASQARGGSKAFGTNFSNRLEDVVSGRITNVDTLAPELGGDKSPISSSGYDQLSKVQEEMQTPEGAAFYHGMGDFLKIAKSTITGSGIPGIQGWKRQGMYDKFVATMLPTINAMKEEGKTAQEIFADPKSPVVQAMQANAPDPVEVKKMAGAEAIVGMINPGAIPSTVSRKTEGFDIAQVKTRGDFVKHFHDMSEDDFNKKAIELGLAVPDPVVPKPFQ